MRWVESSKTGRESGRTTPKTLVVVPDIQNGAGCRWSEDGLSHDRRTTGII